MTIKKFGYCRVSDKTQNLDRQLEEMRKHVENERDIYCDKASGKDMNREQYQLLKAQLREGDILYIKSIDRLGRKYDDILTEWREITKDIKAHIVVLDMPILDTTQDKTGLLGTVITDVVLALLSYVAEQERTFIRQRQREGIDLAKAKGKYSKETIKIKAPDGFADDFRKAANGDITHTENMRKYNLKKTTYYRIAKELGLKSDKVQIKK